MVEEAQIERAEQCAQAICVALKELRDLCEDARTPTLRVVLRGFLDDIRDALEETAGAAR